tara:strand:+ start:785 stop:1162 length:378 start_codon:yes stop_codon:yes gene_type:complete
MAKQTRKHRVTHKKTMTKWLKCIKKVNDKQLTKKEFSAVKHIQNKMKYNAKLQAPRIVINMNKTILKRKEYMPDMAITIANRMIHQAKQDIKKNKTKKFKKITAKEMQLIKQYQKNIISEVKKRC